MNPRVIPAYTTLQPLQLRTLRTHPRTQALRVSDFLHVLRLITDWPPTPLSFLFFVFVFVI